jgi:hypothetical protein
MGKEPKHHYIPEFYLQRWTDPASGKLIEFCRRYEGVVPRPTAPGGTGYVRGLYKLPDAEPGEEYVIETKLMKSIDNWASKALQSMMVDGPFPGKLEPGQALGWCQFLYSLIVRTPEHLERMREKMTTLAPAGIIEHIRDDYPRIKGPGDPPTFDEYKEAFLKRPVAVPAIRVLPELVRSKRVVGVLASFKWQTATVNTAKHPLLTSDRPIVMSNGLLQQDAHIVLAISPRKLFIATKTEETFQFFKEMDTNHLVEAMNNQVCQQAHRFVFGSGSRALRFVEKRLGKRVWSSPIG